MTQLQFLATLNELTQEGFNKLGITDNGAVSNALVDRKLEREGLMGMFYKSVRGVDDNILTAYVEKAADEDVIRAILLAFHIRDCRGGKGERDIARKCFEVLAKKTELLEKVLVLIPEYGRWDDLVYLSSTATIMKEKIFDIIHKRLEEDLVLGHDGRPISLCAKWMPSERYSLDKKTKFVKQYTNYIGITVQEYRRKYIVPLRRYSNIVETKLCRKVYEDIDYSKVPSCAMHKLEKAFARNDPERFAQWKTGLEKGETKVNASQLFPHEIIKKYLSLSIKDTLLEAQWKEIRENTKKLNTFKSTMVICDVSGSMMSGNNGVIPIHVSLALGILISECAEYPFTNNIITFHDKPTNVNIDANSLFEKIRKLQRIPWGMSTNIQAVFDLLLDAAKINKLSNETMVKQIIIVSDMQWNQACPGNMLTNFETARLKFKSAGYELPNVVFWNVNGKFRDFPVTIDETGTILVSGFSQSVMKYIIEGKEVTPWGILLNTINSERYKKIRDMLVNE